MRPIVRPFVAAASVAALCVSMLAHASAPAQHSRVIVSSTLNSTLMFLDAQSLAETQPPLPVRGTGPVRMVVTHDGCGSTGCQEPRLFTANHGAGEGSVGMYALSGDVVLETPLSPFPARAGAVGIDAATVNVAGHDALAVLVTNTTFALGGCSMPTGSVTAYERVTVETPAGYAEALREAGTVPVHGPIPYAVAIAGPHRKAFASTNCGNMLDTIDFSAGAGATQPAFTVATNGAGAATGSGPDGVVYDPRTDRIYVANIGSSSVSIFSASGGSAIATVSLPAARPIDIALADSPGGHHWLVTSNGGDDSISLIDRDVMAGCVGSCPAEAARFFTGVKGGAPEGVAYDPASNRIFAVNKTIGAPSLSVFQIIDESGPVLAAAPVTVPLPALGRQVGGPPSLIAFDVVVQQR